MARTLGSRHLSMDTRSAILRGIKQGLSQVELSRLFDVSKLGLGLGSPF